MDRGVRLLAKQFDLLLKCHRGEFQGAVKIRAFQVLDVR